MNTDPDAALDTELRDINARYWSSVEALLAAGVGRGSAIAAAVRARDEYLAERPALKALAERRYREDEEARAVAVETVHANDAALMSGRRASWSRPGQLPIADLRSMRRLARELGMPAEVIAAGRVRHAPPLAVPDARWRGFTVEMFGEELLGADVPPFDKPAPWAGWFSDNPASPLAVRAWRLIVRHGDSEAWVEARRDERGRWTIMIRGLEDERRMGRAQTVLRGVGLLRSQYHVPGPGRRTKWTPAEFARISDREIVAWRKRTGTRDEPSPKQVASWVGMAARGRPYESHYYQRLARRMKLGP